MQVPKSQKQNLIWLVLSLIVIILDQTSKYIVSHTLNYQQAVPIFSFFNLTLSHNAGAAWGFLNIPGGLQRWMFIAISLVVSIFLIVWIYRLKPNEKITALGLSLVLGGAIGNLYDRVIHGYVIDFIQVYYQQWLFPDFNIADSAISIGAVLVICTMLFKKTNNI